MSDDPKYAPGGIINDDRLTIVGTWRGVDAPEVVAPIGSLFGMPVVEDLNATQPIEFTSTREQRAVIADPGT